VGTPARTVFSPHWALRRRFLTISFEPETALANGWSIRWWDFLFYLSFGIVITFSVPIAGVLLVFSFLVVPAAVAFQFTRRQRTLAAISWIAGTLASAGGLWLSFRYDLPTGPVIVWCRKCSPGGYPRCSRFQPGRNGWGSIAARRSSSKCGASTSARRWAGAR